MYSKTIVVGRVGQDPRAMETRNGDAVASFSVATDDGWGDNKRTEWYNVVAFRKTAEFVNNYVKKGRVVVVEGRMQTDTYEKDGEQRKAVKLIASSVQALPDGSRSNGGNKPADDDVIDEMPF